MAEGVLGGILGGEEEKAEAEAPEALNDAKAFAAAVAANLSATDPEVARDTSAFLKKQTQLLDTQNRHLEDEHALRVAHLRNQIREEGVRRFGLRLRVAFQLFVALAATAIGLGFAVMLRDAFHSRTVIIEPFEAPQVLADRGLTGTAVASALLDQLTQLQSATRTAVIRRGLANAWSNEVQLTVPEAGISFSELSRLLRARFGHDIHVRGDVVQAEAGNLQVTVRGDGLLPHTFEGASNQLGTLISEAAEYVYAQSQPVLWAAYLVDSGRYREAIEHSQKRVNSSSLLERPALFNYWGLAIAKSSGMGGQAHALFERAIALQPDYWEVYGNLMNVIAGQGNEEGAWTLGEQVKKLAGGRPGKAPGTVYTNVDIVTWDMRAMVAAFAGDIDTSSGSGNTSYAIGPVMAFGEVFMHDSAAAELALATTSPDASDPTIAPVTHFVRGLLAADSGDKVRAVDEMEEFMHTYSNPAVQWVAFGLNCWVAPAEEAAGHPDKADAILSTGGTFVDCYRFHGDILDSRGDWTGAKEWYAKTVKLAPDLPAGYYSWGMALAKHGDIDGAVSKLRVANQKGPHWADPLKAWGDVLMQQNNAKEALAKYDEALQYAPNWQQLKAARDTAAKLKS